MTAIALSTETARIRDLNDAFRRAPSKHGKLVTTSGVASLPFASQLAIFSKVMNFDEFSPDNDPNGEHDFGSFDFHDETIFWKIDYYDSDCEYGSEDPADPSKTTRVMTVMLASEY
ncbi:DUF3768 domain-containing protein [uncultured Rhodoblastus sp.]|uniref:DUF3768 domain-containing protein n=1 Tax=uncultured Rhodoblastus sp. TaxID=543037 RepID=UPI0025FA4DAF|nr:DUF3768 domain-containing protein [uncultured Rhodoblastus sp.]